MMGILDNLLRGICEHPADTHRRLVYADACEDAGDVDRAELIRVQCEFPAASLRSTHTVCHHDRTVYGCCCRCEWCGLRERSRQLLHAPAPGLWNPNPGNGWVWAGVELHNAGLHISWKYHNGFPDHITCDCWTWEHHGPKIVASVPVVRVELSDKKAIKSQDGMDYRWTNRSSGCSECWEIPTAIFAYLLPSKSCSFVRDGAWLSIRAFDSESDANAALSVGCIRWARSVAELPPLEKQP